MPESEPTYLKATEHVFDAGIRAGDILEVDFARRQYKIIRTEPIEKFPALSPHLPSSFVFLAGPSLLVRPGSEENHRPKPLRLVE